MIAFCGVHFMAETASVLSPSKTVLIPDLDAGCSLADAIRPTSCAPGRPSIRAAITVMYVNTTAEVKALTDYCVTSPTRSPSSSTSCASTAPDTEILFGPDMFLGAYVERRIGRSMHVWDGECHVHAGIRPRDIEQVRAAHPGADFLIHPECGCSTSVMEYAASGDIDADGVHMLSTGGMLRYAESRSRARRRSSRRRSACCTRCARPRPTRSSSPPTSAPPAVHEDDHAAEAARRACATSCTR